MTDGANYKLVMVTDKASQVGSSAIHLEVT